MSSKKVEPHTDSNKRYHLWLDQSLAKEDIDYMFFDPASDREYTVNIRMGSSDWLYLVMLSYDNGEPDGWYEHLNPDLRGGYMYDELSALKVDIIRLLRERFPAVEGWNDDLLPHYDKPINIRYSSPFYPKEFYNYFDFDFIKGDAPFALDVVGDIRLLRRAPYFQSRVAIIGSRKPDEHGLDVAYRLGQYHSSEIVVSGLALGIDTAAHRGCLDTGGRTIAVVGSGLDRVHPKENAEIQAEIISHGGLIVSEQKIGTKTSPKTLIARTRIQMAMADKVVVVQCERESGTMHAVDFARRFRRPIFALDCDWSGNRYLIDNQIAIPFKM